MFSFLRLSPSPSAELLTSALFDETTFYASFIQDLKRSRQEVIIESPFVTNRRLGPLLPVFEKLKSQNVRIVVNTRDPGEHDDEYARYDARQAVSKLQHTGGHHRKLAILDRKILYEGSLNILSQNASCEVMRRIESPQLA
jgi:hypothetical protein